MQRARSARSSGAVAATDPVVPPPPPYPHADERIPAIKLLLLPKDTNAMGTIFGGVILSHIDLASAVEARKVAARRYVTKAMREVEFHQPVFLGDIVSFYTETVRVGRTSITVRVSVEAERWGAGHGEKVKVTEAEVVLVAVDEQRPADARSCGAASMSAAMAGRAGPPHAEGRLPARLSGHLRDDGGRRGRPRRRASAATPTTASRRASSARR